MYYEFFQEHKRRIITIAIAVFTLFTLWSATTLILRAGKTPLTISAVPSDAKVIANGQNLSDGTHWLPAGDYVIVVEKNGFESQTRTVTVTPSKKNNVTAISLMPKSDEAKKWADKHQSDYQQNEQFGAIEARANGEYFTEKNPITTKMPFTDPYFSISYVVNDDQSIYLTVSTPSPRYRFYAVEKIREWGYDPTDFDIRFKEFKNPLGSVVNVSNEVKK